MNIRQVVVRRTRTEDFAGIRKLCGVVYPDSASWSTEQLESHLRVFPQGQLVALLDDEVVGMAASLVVRWNDYDLSTSWRDFTDNGYFTNHDPERGHTLYGAEVMVSPDHQGHGIGTKLYGARFRIAEQLKLLRIRAGARLQGYHLYSHELTAEQYVEAVIADEITDPTLTFQLRRGFSVLGVVSGYLRHDPKSLGYAAVIEWVNPQALRSA